MQLSRAMLDALLPPGTLWQPQEGEGFDNLLAGIADCMEVPLADLKHLAHVRDPLNTALLDDLEREYGVIPRAGSDEFTRRARLAAVKAAGSGDGSLTFLQNSLDKAGFDLHVYANSPLIDPGLFVLYTPSAICGNDIADCGDSAAGAIRGEILVNGAVYENQEIVNYQIPTDHGYWPLFFFISGGMVRENGTGVILDILDGTVPAARRGELKTLILKCKPMFSWAALRIQYV